MFVIEKTHRDGSCSAESSPSGDPSIFESQSDAQWVLNQMSDHSAGKRRIRPATDAERKNGQLVRPRRRSKSAGSLVDIHANDETRQYAIMSRAENESEFMSEVAIELAQLPSNEDMEIRYRELLPLIVDLCCRYRGYKCERVHQRVVLIAGDVEMPSPITLPETIEASNNKGED